MNANGPVFHLPGEHLVCFSGSQPISAALTRSKDSTLVRVVFTSSFVYTTLHGMGWFKANEHDPSGRHLLYCDYVDEFTWDTTSRKWHPGNLSVFLISFHTIQSLFSSKVYGHHRRKAKQAPPVGRMAWVPPTSGERYFLRVLARRWNSRGSNNVQRPPSDPIEPCSGVHVI